MFIFTFAGSSIGLDAAFVLAVVRYVAAAVL